MLDLVTSHTNKQIFKVMNLYLDKLNKQHALRTLFPNMIFFH